MRYPVSKLPKSIISALTNEMASHGYTMPVSIDLLPATTYSYYLPGEAGKIGCVLEVNRTTKAYAANFGTWGGDVQGAKPGLVNSNKIERPLTTKMAVCKLYIVRANHTTTGIVYLPPGEMPPIVPDVTLTERERSLMFIFGIFREGSERALALVRMDVKATELDALVAKQALRKTKNGHAITIAGLAAKSEQPTLDKW